jgi:polyhydroxyalkanoate synthesis regulator phasin
MDLQSKEAKNFYENTLKEAKKQIEIIDAKIEEELAQVKETINNLQEQKKAVRQIYDGAALLLGVKNEFEDEEKSETIE